MTHTVHEPVTPPGKKASFLHEKPTTPRRWDNQAIPATPSCTGNRLETGTSDEATWQQPECEQSHRPSTYGMVGMSGDSDSTASGYADGSGSCSDDVSARLGGEQSPLDRRINVDSALRKFGNSVQDDIAAQLGQLREALVTELRCSYRFNANEKRIWNSDEASRCHVSDPQLVKSSPLLEKGSSFASAVGSRFPETGQIYFKRLDTNHTCLSELAHPSPENDDLDRPRTSFHTTVALEEVVGKAKVSARNTPPSEDDELTSRIWTRNQELAFYATGTPLQRFVWGSTFEAGSMILVLANISFMLVESEVGSMSVKLKMAGADAPTWYHTAEDCFMLVTHIFNLLFIAEIGLKLYAYGKRFFNAGLNILDLVIIMISMCEALFSLLLDVKWLDLKFLRIMRMLELCRVAKAVRNHPMFSELRVMLQTVASAFRSTIWSGVLLGMIIVCSGLLISQLVTEHVTDPRYDAEFQQWLFTRYGSTSRAAWTMFMATMSGGWPQYALPLVERVSPWFVLFWLSYVLAVVFAVLRALGAMFIRATLKAASVDEDMMVMEKMKENDTMSGKLQHFFASADADGDGVLETNEFNDFMHSDRVAAWLELLLFEKHEIIVLFNMLKDEDGRVPIHELVDGSLRLKGNARAIDVILIMREQHAIKSKLQCLMDTIILSAAR